MNMGKLLVSLVLFIEIGAVFGTATQNLDCRIKMVNGSPQIPSKLSSIEHTLCYLEALKYTSLPRYGKRNMDNLNFYPRLISPKKLIDAFNDKLFFLIPEDNYLRRPK